MVYKLLQRASSSSTDGQDWFSEMKYPRSLVRDKKKKGKKGTRDAADGDLGLRRVSEVYNAGREAEVKESTEYKSLTAQRR